MGKKRRSAGGKKIKFPRLSIYIGVILIAVSSVLAFRITNQGIPECGNSISCATNLSGSYQNESDGTFLGQKVAAPTGGGVTAYDNYNSRQVLGEAKVDKHIFVDLSTQKLFAYEGDKMIYEFNISSGKWGRTPTGDFKIWIKLLYTKMEGGSGSDYYNLPNVPYTMFFYNDEISKSRGFSIHGAYWHNNFGYPMSHGCVNMRQEDAATLYDWADPVATGRITHASGDNPGTAVTIYGQAPI